jgi:hypothetical protein
MIVYAAAGWHETVRRLCRWWEHHPWHRHPEAAAADAERYRRQEELLQRRQAAIRAQIADQRARLRALELRARMLAGAATADGGNGGRGGEGPL